VKPSERANEASFLLWLRKRGERERERERERMKRREVLIFIP
jgi:hypothetical protein